MKKELSEYYSDDKKTVAKVFMDEINDTTVFKVAVEAEGYTPSTAIFLSEVEAEDYAEDWVQLHG